MANVMAVLGGRECCRRLRIEFQGDSASLMHCVDNLASLDDPRLWLALNEAIRAKAAEMDGEDGHGDAGDD